MEFLNLYFAKRHGHGVGDHVVGGDVFSRGFAFVEMV
jgi:hypothetical protein